MPDDDRALMALLSDMCVRADGIAEALEALCDSASVAAAARKSGIGMRTLQRLMLRETGVPPQYFLRLARARRAARAVDGNAALAEIAFAHGYADQAHFSRECRQWFGVTPKALKSRLDLRAMLDLPAYA
jgi:AraC-like DNA-binding protein